MKNLTEIQGVHSSPRLSPAKAGSAHPAPCGKAYGEAMTAFAAQHALPSTETSTADVRPIHGFVLAGDALARAMRAVPALRPIAEEVEGGRASA